MRELVKDTPDLKDISKMEIKVSIKSIIYCGCLCVGTLQSLATTAVAGGLSVIVEPPLEPVQIAVPDVDWTGFYAGGKLSLPTVDASILEDTGDGVAIGAHGGYLYDFGQLVVGAELDVNLTAIESWSNDFPLSTIASARVRIGYDAGDFLPYVAAGVSEARLAGDVDETDDGSFASVGVDYRLSNNITLGAEYAHYRYDDFAGTGEDFDVSAAGARLSYRF